MFSFLKNNSYLIVRLLLNQIGMTMFGIMTSMAAAAIDNVLADGSEVGQTCMIWASVFSVLFYMYINYMALKEEGQKDKIRLDAGRAEYMPARGLYIALAASAVNLLLGFFIVATEYLGSTTGLALEWAGAVCGTSKVFATLIQAMYLGLMRGISGTSFEFLPSFWFIIIPLPTILCGFISYWFGLTDRGIFKFIKKFFTPEETAKRQK